MSKLRLSFHALALVVFTLAFTSMAQAQATRTWVSGVGDDANPCSRTAPCKTFAGAISKTADKGEIDCIDPGGFGAVTLTKSVTIDGGGTFASILAAGTNGVNVNDGATATPNTIIVKLRNLSINGAGTGFIGVNFTSGKALFVENCIITGFKGNATSSHGISVNVNGTGSQQVFVRDTNIIDNTGSGISSTAAAFGVGVVVDHCHLDKNQNGIFAQNNTNLWVTNSLASLNVGAGVAVQNTVSANLDTNSLQLNGGAGLSLTNIGGTVRISNNNITGNASGVQCSPTNPNSYQDNKIKGNGTDLNGCTDPLPNLGKK
jgi:hypothetical protein